MGKLLKFAGNKINRLEVERREEEWIKQKFKDPKYLYRLKQKKFMV